MKTTLELPDKLMKRVKIHAAHRGLKFKDAVAQLLEAGFTAEPEALAEPIAPTPVRLKKRGPLTINDIEAAVASGRE